MTTNPTAAEQIGSPLPLDLLVFSTKNWGTMEMADEARTRYSLCSLPAIWVR